MTPVEYAEQVPGWMTTVELTYLSQLAASLPPGATWIEVGTWMGRSWSCVALSLPSPATLIAVDTFDGGGQDDEPQKYVAAHGPVLNDFLRTRDDVLRRRDDLSSQIMAIASTRAATFVQDGTCDVVFIDG